ncbi:hypothetical protein AQUCO_00100237v1 [Aquilegia coerulea]|uniref:Protein kinase domain-containing protein n=1 Tax=Aquilegia coerulea TaxID=218851 RepID=A0A2G5F9I6_AQUCA|nr:hypothetical protein AQUCO_00100237v1 [Aquilegia coerulea]
MNITGKIPSSICDLENLNYIDLSSNYIHGEFPTVLYNCSKLQALYLHENSFFGPIPADIDRISTLQRLDLGANNFSGDIPASIGNLPELEMLFLYNNQFNGSFPPEIGNLSNLQYLELNNNPFVPSKIPNEFGRLKKLGALLMRKTNLIGEIPIEICDLINLRDFDLSINSLTGKIPANLFLLVNMEYFRLSGNKLSGEIPGKIKTLYIYELGLSMNQFTGEIPPTLLLLPNLSILDLSNNQLSGAVPPIKIGRRLVLLNLSSNRLTGKIPDVYANWVYDKSFLNNTGLCPSNSDSKCLSETRDSSRLPVRFLAMILVLAGAVFLIVVLSAFSVIKNYYNRKQGGDLNLYKMTFFQRLDFTELNILSKLTENNLIGSGGSGKVYRVDVNRSRNYVAVKKISSKGNLDQKLEKQFEAEVEILGNIRHLNIVKLLCCISNGKSKLLVYEYMKNHSLDEWLHGKKRGTLAFRHFVLDWPRRMHIAVGAAQGLCHMHHNCNSFIIHRDVKSSNILLDSEFNAKIADFGLAKILAKTGESETMSVVAGTFGYIAPEYARTTKATEKIDVYSFGVVLLELVTGREATKGDEYTCLAEWAWRHFQEDKAIESALDEDVKEPFYLDEMSMVFKLGLICTSTSSSTRPSMKDVVQFLLRNGSLQREERTIVTESDAAPLQNLTSDYLD